MRHSKAVAKQAQALSSQADRLGEVERKLDLVICHFQIEDPEAESPDEAGDGQEGLPPVSGGGTPRTGPQGARKAAGRPKGSAKKSEDDGK